MREKSKNDWYHSSKLVLHIGSQILRTIVLEQNGHQFTPYQFSIFWTRTLSATAAAVSCTLPTLAVAANATSYVGCLTVAEGVNPAGGPHGTGPHDNRAYLLSLAIKQPDRCFPPPWRLFEKCSREESADVHDMPTTTLASLYL